MPLASQYKSEQRIFALLVGRSGDGKSVAAASFPRPLFNLDFDMRFGGVASAIKQGIILDTDMEYQQFPPRAGIIELNKRLEQFEIERASNHWKYATIQTDSLTNLARLFLNVSRKEQKGMVVAKHRLSGPGDYKFESSATHDYFDFMRTFPCNILCTAHIVDRYGRPENQPEEDRYQPAEIIGEKLVVRDNLGESVLTYFDNVWRFSREKKGNCIEYFVEFATDLAKNSFGIPPGKHNITNKNFYSYLMEVIKK